MSSHQIGFSPLGEIARRLNVPVHRVEYVIRTREISPLIVAGGRNFYSEASIEQISQVIAAIDARAITRRSAREVDNA